MIELVRLYDFNQANPQYHYYLVDRLWPRGISKQQLAGVIWLKEVAPSNELRKLFHQQLIDWQTFQQQYWQELQQTEAWMPLFNLFKENQTLVLLYGSKDPKQNHAVILKSFIEQL